MLAGLLPSLQLAAPAGRQLRPSNVMVRENKQALFCRPPVIKSYDDQLIASIRELDCAAVIVLLKQLPKRDNISDLLSTALISAAKLSDQEAFPVVLELLKAKAAISAHALWGAIDNGRVQIVEAMLKTNIDIHSLGNESVSGLPPLELACKLGDSPLAKKLLEYKATFNPEIFARAQEWQVDRTELLLDCKADVNSRNLLHKLVITGGGKGRDLHKLIMQINSLEERNEGPYSIFSSCPAWIFCCN